MTPKESDIRESFIWQAEACEMLGSIFTGRLCRLVSAKLSATSELGNHIFNWGGDYRASADNVALRLCGAINHLALTGADREIAGIYPPFGSLGHQDNEMAWTVINGAINRNLGAIKTFMQSPPQTNEVRRSAALIPAYHAIAARFELPIKLHELGASAGLNLYPDLYGINTPQVKINTNADLVLDPEWHGEIPQTSNLIISERKACDLSPVDISLKTNRSRMLAYIWPDQIDRVKRTKAAIELASANPNHRVEQADAIAWLERNLFDRPAKQVCVFHHTIAWQYFPIELQAKGEALFKEHGAKATDDAPLVRIAMESDGKDARQGALLTMTIWPTGEIHNLGRADFHGRWVDWRNPFC